MGVVSRVLLGGRLEPDVLEGAERSTFVRVDDPLRQYSSFLLRLVAATVVATAPRVTCGRGGTGSRP